MSMEFLVLDDQSITDLPTHDQKDNLVFLDIIQNTEVADTVTTRRRSARRPAGSGPAPSRARSARSGGWPGRSRRRHGRRSGVAGSWCRCPRRARLDRRAGGPSGARLACRWVERFLDADFRQRDHHRPVGPKDRMDRPVQGEGIELFGRDGLAFHQDQIAAQRASRL